VEAKPEDWSVDPFKLTQQEGWFYGRGTIDMKDGDAALVESLIRLRREKFIPDHDVIVAFTADEEAGGDANGPAFLLKEHRDLIDAALVVNLDGAGIQQTLWVDPASHRVRRSEVRGPKSYELSFDDFQGFASTEFPRQTTLAVPGETTRLELKYRDLELNPRLDASLFDLAPPSGMAVIEVDEAGNPRARSPVIPGVPLGIR